MLICVRSEAQQLVHCQVHLSSGRTGRLYHWFMPRKWNLHLMTPWKVHAQWFQESSGNELGSNFRVSDVDLEYGYIAAPMGTAAQRPVGSSLLFYLQL